MRRRRYATIAIVFITQREWRVTYLASYKINIYLWSQQLGILHHFLILCQGGILARYQKDFIVYFFTDMKSE